MSSEIKHRVYVLLSFEWQQTSSIRARYKHKHKEEIAIGTLHTLLDELEKEEMAESEYREPENSCNPYKARWVRKTVSGLRKKLEKWTGIRNEGNLGLASA